MNEISLKELKRYYDDLSDNYSILQEKFGNEMKRNNELNSKLAQTVNQYNAVVQQNHNLQQELAAYKETLIQISQNEHCVCSLDGTCQPQRQAMNALAEGLNK